MSCDCSWQMTVSNSNLASPAIPAETLDKFNFGPQKSYQDCKFPFLARVACFMSTGSVDNHQFEPENQHFFRGEYFVAMEEDRTSRQFPLRNAGF